MLEVFTMLVGAVVAVLAGVALEYTVDRTVSRMIKNSVKQNKHLSTYTVFMQVHGPGKITFGFRQWYEELPEHAFAIAGVNITADVPFSENVRDFIQVNEISSLWANEIAIKDAFVAPYVFKDGYVKNQALVDSLFTKAYRASLSRLSEHATA